MYISIGANSLLSSVVGGGGGGASTSTAVPAIPGKNHGFGSGWVFAQIRPSRKKNWLRIRPSRKKTGSGSDLREKPDPDLTLDKITGS